MSRHQVRINCTRKDLTIEISDFRHVSLNENFDVSFRHVSFSKQWKRRVFVLLFLVKELRQRKSRAASVNVT